jgi:hypothetical protein
VLPASAVALALVLPCLSPTDASCAQSGAGQAPRRLFVLRGPDAIVEYDLATLTARRTFTVPRQILDDPGHLDVNGTGQMLFVPPASTSDHRTDS